jgi:hypothetical protein
VLIILVLCLGVGFTAVEGAGLATAWGTDPQTSGDAVQKALNDSSDASAVQKDEPVVGDAATENGDSNIVSLILSGAQRVASAFGKVVLLPLTLHQLGVPAYLAYPLGSVINVVAGIAIIQFITGRVLR